MQIPTVGEDLRNTARDALFIFCGVYDTDVPTIESVSFKGAERFRFLSSWNPNLPICVATYMMLEPTNFRGMPFDRWLSGAILLVNAHVGCPDPVTHSAVGFVAGVIALYGGTAPPKTHGLYHLMAQMISLRLDLKPLLETDAEFDLVRWADEGLDNISAAKLSKITAPFLKKAPKTFMIQKKVNDSEADGLVNV